MSKSRRNFSAEFKTNLVLQVKEVEKNVGLTNADIETRVSSGKEAKEVG